jgi:hypothetical protein
MWLAFAYVVGGGLLCGYRILHCKETIINRSTDLELVNWIRQFVPRSSVLLINPRLLHPAVLAGIPLFLGDKRAIYAGGINLHRKYFDFDAVVAQNATKQTWDLHNIRFAVEEIGEFELPASLEPVKSNAKYRLVRFA